MTRSTLAFLVFGSLAALFSSLSAQEPPLPAREGPALLKDDGSRVSVLGYHVFHATQSPSEMRIQTAKFRQQMQTIKDSKIPVISLPQFLAWRRGEIEIPPKSFLITMDDGWKSVYTEAFPIMKEFQLPFTVFLYKNYVGSHCGGRALSLEMINEMVDSGLCSIGSHSVSHPYPSDVKSAAKKGPEAYLQFLNTEFGDSMAFLEDTFKSDITTYAYPGGYHTEEMFPIAHELGYDHLFTVMPGKIRRDSDSFTLPRYIVLGNHDGSFNASLVFRNSSRSASVPVSLPHPTQPESGEIVASRLPIISVDLSKVVDLDPESVVMCVAGFDQVPVQMNPGTKIFQWTVSRPLRQAMCEVTAQWKLRSKKSLEPVMSWSFRVDREATYQAN